MKQLTLYFTSDIHGYFYPTTYADKDMKNMGLFSCASQFIKEENTLVIDGGDMLQGSAFASYYAQEIKDPTKMAEIINACGYDYITIGNHDFNYGTKYLKAYLKKLNASCVCQNVTDEAGKILYPYQIKTMENGLRVGVIGIVTDFVNIWEKEENLLSVQVKDPFQAVQDTFELLKKQCNVTICIYHGGFEKDLKTEEVLSKSKENIGCKICEELDFDVLLTGHQHMYVEGQYYHGTYVVQSRENGMDAQRLEIHYEEKDKEKVTIEARRMVPNGENLHSSAKIFVSQEEEVQNWLDCEIGSLKEDLMPKEKLEMALHGSLLADFFNEVQLFYSKAQISAVGLANTISGLRKIVTRRNILTTYPYPNTLVVCEISGKALKQAMERSMEYFAISASGEIVISDRFLVPKVEHYNYDYFMGVDFKRDYYAPIGSRVKELKYQDIPVKEEDVFTICLNNYRASGAGEYPMYKDAKVIREINIGMSDLLMDYIQLKQKKLS